MLVKVHIDKNSEFAKQLHVFLTIQYNSILFINSSVGDSLIVFNFERKLECQDAGIHPENFEELVKRCVRIAS